MLRVTMMLPLIRSVPAILPTLLRIAVVDIHDPKIVFRMLVHILRGYTIPGCIRITRQLYIFFIYLICITADTDAGTVAIEALVPRGRITTPPAAAARPLGILTLSHITVT